MISPAALEELKARHPCDQVAGKWVALRRHGRNRMIGPCPICSDDPQSNKATRFEVDAEGWVCAVCQEGGDVIKLVERKIGKDFRGAVEWLGGAREIPPAEAEKLEGERAEKRARRERQAAEFRERKRRTLWDIWHHAVPIAGTPARTYLELRGITRELPARAPLRFVAAMPYYDTRSRPPAVIHRGPAMIAVIVRDGRFSGLHFTYLAADGGKAVIPDPLDAGELMPAKKVRGSKAGGAIELVRVERPRRLFAGEGIETVWSMWQAHVALGRTLYETAFWSSVDLGNLAGAALDSVEHPTLRDERGRPRRVPGPDPDMSSPAMPVPESVEELVLLGDGDSDPFTTELALQRAARRNHVAGRVVRIAWSPAGTDFNDLLRGAA